MNSNESRQVLRARYRREEIASYSSKYPSAPRSKRREIGHHNGITKFRLERGLRSPWKGIRRLEGN